MATIPTLNTSDTPSTVVSDIQTGLNNLNTDKIEATTTVTLTNKTIDADSNTISNIETDNLKASAKSGSDTTLITGTAGTSGNLVSWDANGDAVDSTYDVSNSTSTSDSTTIWTSSASKSYTDSVLSTTTTEFLQPRVTTASTIATTITGAYTIDATQSVEFVWKAPSTYSSLSSINFVLQPDATETMQADLTAYSFAVGDTYTTKNTSQLNTTQSVTLNTIVNYTNSTFTTAVDGIVEAGDYVTIRFASDVSNAVVLGCQITWTNA